MADKLKMELGSFLLIHGFSAEETGKMEAVAKTTGFSILSCADFAAVH